MASKRDVGAGRVREWFAGLDAEAREAAGLAEATIGQRGKISQAIITAFEKANKRERYAAKLVPTRKITGTRVNPSNGRKQTVTVTDTLENVRAWAKAEGLEVGARGRVSQEVLSAFAARPKAEAPAVQAGPSATV